MHMYNLQFKLRFRSGLRRKRGRKREGGGKENGVRKKEVERGESQIQIQIPKEKANYKKQKNVFLFFNYFNLPQKK